MENKKIKIYSQKYDQVYLLKEIFLISRIDIFKEKKKVFAHRIWIQDNAYNYSGSPYFFNSSKHTVMISAIFASKIIKNGNKAPSEKSLLA